MKYFLGYLDIRNGEYEYHHIQKIMGVCQEDAQIKLEENSKEFYGEPDVTQFGDPGHYFHGGCVYVEAGSLKQVSKSTFDEVPLY